MRAGITLSQFMGVRSCSRWGDIAERCRDFIRETGPRRRKASVPKGAAVGQYGVPGVMAARRVWDAEEQFDSEALHHMGP